MKFRTNFGQEYGCKSEERGRIRQCQNPAAIKSIFHDCFRQLDFNLIISHSKKQLKVCI